MSPRSRTSCEPARPELAPTRPPGRDPTYREVWELRQHHRHVTFVRRLQQDVREHRKPAGVLVCRGLLLLRDEPRVVRRCLDVAHTPSTLAHRGLIRFPFIFN
jgi:hypothetical protein